VHDEHADLTGQVGDDHAARRLDRAERGVARLARPLQHDDVAAVHELDVRGRRKCGDERDDRAKHEHHEAAYNGS
jgi:hypothetical protein